MDLGPGSNLGSLCEGSLSSATSLNPPPSPATSCPMLAAGCPGLASAVRSHFPSPQWVRHSLLLSTPFSTPPLPGRGWLRKKEREEGGGRWCESVLVTKEAACPGLLLPLCAPSHLSLPRSSQYYPRLCVCSQPGEEVEPDGRRMGGSVEEMVTAGLIWAPGEKRLLTQEKLGRNSGAGDGERKLCLGVGVILG